MNRIVKIFLLSIILIFGLCTYVKADTLDDLGEESGAYSLGEHLPDEARDTLDKLGIRSNDFSTIENLDFRKIITYLSDTISDETSGIVPSLCTLLAILLLYSIFNGVFDSCTNSALSGVLSVVSSLCLACPLLFPVTNLISDTSTAIEVSADFMLAYIPVMTAVLISAGQTVTGSGYSAMMFFAAEMVGQFFSKVISPLLRLFLTLGISSSVVSEIKLSGLIGFFSKTIKWLMSFVFTIFTAVLSLKSIFSSSVENVSSRAVRYTMSSIIPVVGGALSEAYRTVHGSVGVLKSGIGVFVIISIITVFIPVIIRLLLWLVTINMCKSLAESTLTHSPTMILSTVSTVLSLMLSVIFCIVALFVITTALIITIGGAS